MKEPDVSKETLSPVPDFVLVLPRSPCLNFFSTLSPRLNRPAKILKSMKQQMLFIAK